jgi:dynactin 1
MNAADLRPGQAIELIDGRIGFVRHVGPVHFQTGEWVGIELQDSTGKNDGSVQGQRYFDCEQGYGMFLRPTGVRQVLDQPGQQPPKEAQPQPQAKPKPTGVSGAAGIGKPRPSSIHAGGNGVRKQDVAPGRRASAIMETASPTPGARSGLSGLRSPVKSPTKQLGGNGISSTSTSRTSTPPTAAARRTAGTTAPAPTTRTRPSVGGTQSTAPSKRTSMMPPAAVPGTSRTRPSATVPSSARAPAARAPPARPAAVRPTPSTRTVPGRRDSEKLSNHAANTGSPQPDLLSPRESDVSSAISQAETDHEAIQDDDEDAAKPNFAPPPPPPIPLDNAPKTTSTRRTSSPPASLHSQRTVRSSAQSARQIEELEAKIRQLERKRQEDRELKKSLDKVQEDRDRYQGIIEKLQKKYQPQQQEIAELKKQLTEAESKGQTTEELQAEHESIMEMALLDKEMAEEMAEGLKAELDALRANQEELELEVEVLREENSEFSKEMSPEERTSAGWLQMEKENDRLRDALLRLRDLTQDREGELREQVQELQAQVKEFEAFRKQFDDAKEKLLTSEATADDLRQQLEAALGAEEMIEELTERNMSMQEKLDDLRVTIEDLENLRELNDELEINHIEVEKQLSDEIDFKDSLIFDRERTAKQQQEALDDADYTINRFRELVTQLQSDLQDMQASKQISDTEAADLSTKSRAMLDLNLKLQTSAAKTQVKTIDLELRKLDAQEASEHLGIVQLFLPDAFQAERDSVLALLRFKRIGFKANLVQGFIRERIASFGARGLDENVFAACDVMDKLTWVSAMAERFVNAVCTCSVEEFANYEGALYELEPVERALNSYIDALRRDDLKERDMADELQRSVAVMDHLASLHVKDHDIAGHADSLLMRTLCLQGQLESTASALGIAKTLVNNKLRFSQDAQDGGDDDDESEEDDEGIAAAKQIIGRIESLISQARSAKVTAGKTHRALSDLQARSLTLEPSCTDSFEGAESLAAQISAFSRLVGDALQMLFGEEGRIEPFTPHEVSSAISRAATTAFALGTPEAGPFTALAERMRSLADALIDVSSLPTDLDNTVEFERAPAPWVARADQLKLTKLTSIDTEAELSRARETLKEREVELKERDTELEEQSVQIEMLEAKMRNASKRSAEIAKLEHDMHEARDAEQRAKAELTQARKEAELAIERARTESSRLASEQRGKYASGQPLDSNAMGSGTQLTLDRQEHQITSLRGAVRYLHSENQRLKVPPPGSIASSTSSLSWLHQPLIQPKTEKRKRQEALHKEGKDVLTRLLLLGTSDSSPRVVDLTLLPENKLAWRPAKETSRWKVESRREEWEAWRAWRRDVVRKAAVAAPRRVMQKSTNTAAAASKSLPFAEPRIVRSDGEAEGLSVASSDA